MQALKRELGLVHNKISTQESELARLRALRQERAREAQPSPVASLAAHTSSRNKTEEKRLMDALTTTQRSLASVAAKLQNAKQQHSEQQQLLLRDVGKHGFAYL